MRNKYTLVCMVLLCTVMSAFGQTPWINEIHYDNTGDDTNEGVEIAIPIGYSCANNLQVVAYNGNNSQTYATTTVPTTAGTTNNGIDFYWVPMAGLQNGAPDGMALVCTTTNTVIQFLSYEGSITATNGPANGLTSTDIGVSEDGTTTTAQSMQLQGTGCAYSDFSWITNITSTNANINTGQTINCTPPDPDLSITGNTNHAAVCQSTSGTIITYTITNNGIIPATGMTIISDNPEFMVSNMSSTLIPPSGSITYDVIFTPTTIGATAAIITITSATPTSNAPTSNLIGTGITIPSITGQPTDQSVIIPNTATFTVTATNPISYQWQVNTGTGWNNTTTGSGGTSNAYTTPATTLAMDNNQYRCVITNACGTTTSNPATLNSQNLADVLITEIMYNSTGFDDEWIEICNVNTLPQDISNYEIEVNNSSIYYFPANTSIPANSCITVAIGDNGTAPFNPDCPFTPNYGTPSGTNILNNTSATIELIASDNTTVIDVVTYFNTDGADGNGASLHIIDALLDNTNTGNNWQEVIDGGSPEDNTLISPCTTFEPEINVEGNIGTFPDITDGDVTPQGTDNTLFAAQTIGASQTKSYRIQNLGSANLTITNINTVGGNTGDFIVDPALTFPIILEPATLTTFVITFSPIASGVRNTTVNILSDDSDESTYNYRIQGTGNCAANIIDLTPNSGPPGTTINITGSNFGGSNTVTIKDQSNVDVSMPVTVISATEIEVTIPPNAQTSNLEITDNLGCSTSVLFTVLTQDISTCEGNTGTIPANWTDIMITGVFDNSTGACHYIELFNPTNAPIVLTGDYKMGLSNNYDSPNQNLPVNGVNYTFNGGEQYITGTIEAYSTFIVRFGVSGDTCNDCPSVVPDDTIEAPGFGINGFNQGTDPIDIDRIVLFIESTNNYIDLWANSEYPEAGYAYTRDITSVAPAMNYSNTDWISQGTADCFSFQLNPFSQPPTVTVQPISPTQNCNLAVSFTVSATEGFPGGNPLEYQWYYTPSGSSGWIPTPNTTPYSGANTNTLSISNTLNLNNYQYYCQVRENNISCHTSSNTIKLNIQKTTWNNTNTWSNGPPNINTIAIINHDYDTAVNGSFSACQLLINATHKLTIGNSTFIEVENYTTVNGEIWVETQGSFVQNADIPNAFTINPGGNALLNKSTSFLNNWYDYTYWSSPITSETVGDALDIAPPNRRFIFNAQNYLDVFLDNTNNITPGSDDIDDNGDDWEIAPTASIMTPGVGYAATVNPSGFNPGSFPTTFEGSFNNSTITTPVYFNGDNGDNDWNLIGNPYPSAIDFDDLYTENSSVIDGAAYLWSHASPPLIDNDGNQVMNFNANDYAIITVGSGNTAGGDGIIPNAENTIASGQGFFIKALANGNISFNNSMRKADLVSNNQFFKNFKKDDTKDDANRLWIDLTSDNGVYNQILVAYVPGATSGNDGFSYDAPKNLSNGNASFIYTLINGDNKPYAIQGKASDELNINTVIPFSFYTDIEIPTVYSFSIPQFTGDFLSNNTIYLHDKQLSVYHDLNQSDYTFTSEIGTYNNRFEIVFKTNTLELEQEELSNMLSIIELQDGRIKFSTSNHLQIKTVKFYDVLGRILYQLKGKSHTETYKLSNLSQATYITKTELSNGVIITKKSIKRDEN